ncbi:DUF3175 domain-containing protein [Candidatus Nitrospira bockiana]
MASNAKPSRTSKRNAARRSPSTRRRRWSAEVMKRSNALDLEPGVFTKRSPRAIALSLKRSAEASTRRKGTPFQSAMSMLNFHINRAGRTLPAKQKEILNRAKDELRAVFGRARNGGVETR